MFMTISKEAGITVSRFIFFPETEKERSDEREKQTQIQFCFSSSCKLEMSISENIHFVWYSVQYSF